MKHTGQSSSQHVPLRKGAPAPDIVVSLGTDHHPFPRLVEWLDEALEHLPEVSCLLQHGFTRPSERAMNTHRMPRIELLELYHSAQVVIVQGGPGSILDARLTGHIPLAVPRLAHLGEVVDDHQVAFTRRMVEDGEAKLVQGPDDLLTAVTTIMSRPSEFRTEPRVPQPELASQALWSTLDAHKDPWRLRTMGRRSLQTAVDVIGPRFRRADYDQQAV
ncbi:MAG: glycosyl transferase [Kocuria rhizophila]|uniref:glycosyl transferase n=1 Tax=Kocuria carniphila TaxID=262208 RepID=UPI000DB03C35|nr:glycosyl transferase [Kocuria carniphila]MCT1801280.1 glycosyl transferase [Kocuria carniphila]PZP33060.1 MAG: glycosyl transferase [Kocuria rhizophila]